jgi:hypothetical protein
MKPNSLLYFSTLLLPSILFSPGILKGQEKAAGAPAVSADALNSVSAPKAKPARPAGNAASGRSAEVTFPGKTDLDSPESTDPRFLPLDGRRGASIPRLSKIDLDADLDYDGAFDNDSSAGQGQHEYLPPGLELGKGEVSRLLVRFKTYEPDFTGKLVVRLEASEVNRDAVSGEGAVSAGQIRVWRDQERKELLIDSADPAKRSVEWTYDSEKRAGGIPRTLYVEGVKVSAKFEGDLRLLVSASHLADGETSGTPSSLYRAAFDHLLLTVRDKPVEKEFINNNVEGVWSMVGRPAAPVADAGAGGDSSGVSSPQASVGGQ